MGGCKIPGFVRVRVEVTHQLAQRIKGKLQAAQMAANE
jgi:hypothetical protein